MRNRESERVLYRTRKLNGVCVRCGNTPSVKAGLCSICRVKQTQSGKLWRQRNLENGKCVNCARPRDGHQTTCSYCRGVKAGCHRKRTYGLTQRQIQEILNAQSGRCTVCGASFYNRRICVDHCHDTGRVRGLLCPGCNIKIGAIERIVKAGLCDSVLRYLNVR